MNRTTRSRRWVLEVGGGLFLAGSSGVAEEAPAALPAGLYRPSSDHLAHVLRAAAAARPLADYRPRFFGAAELQTVRRIVGTILGEIPGGGAVVTDIVNWIDLTVSEGAEVRAAAASLSPAHRALAVAYYGEASVRHVESFDPQRICREGLAGLAAAPANLPALLHEALDGAGAGDTAVARFLRYLKERAIEGYYTSKEGLRELDYKGNSFYAAPPGCGG